MEGRARVGGGSILRSRQAGTNSYPIVLFFTSNNLIF